MTQKISACQWIDLLPYGAAGNTQTYPGTCVTSANVTALSVPRAAFCATGPGTLAAVTSKSPGSSHTSLPAVAFSSRDAAGAAPASASWHWYVPVVSVQIG